MAVYTVTDQDTVTLMGILDLEGTYIWQPRVDLQSGLVYIPCGSNGVSVVKYDGSKLVSVTTLRCVAKAVSLAVVSPDSLYVCDGDSETICLVDVTQDKVTARLQAPQGVVRGSPCHIAVLGDTILVAYGGEDLVLYRHGVPTLGQLLPRPQGLVFVHGLTTDHHSNFLLMDRSINTVNVLDISGNLTHTIPISGYRAPWDCTVVEDQLWLACDYNGDIIVMSSQ